MVESDTRRRIPNPKMHQPSAYLAKWLWYVFLAGSICTVPVMGQTNPQIISPANGTIVAPGQTVSVAVSAAGVSFTSVGIVTQDIGFGPTAITTKAPYVFQVTIPNNIIGSKTITAFGTTGSGAVEFSSPIAIDVETQATL